MNMIGKIGIGAAIVAIVVAIVPAIKGPYNRIRNEVNESLNQEFVVDNYKAEYIDLHSKKVAIVKNISKFNLETKVAEKKLAYALDKLNVAKDKLRKIGTADMTAFNRAKEQYEILSTEVNNYNTMIGVYSNALVKLEKSLAVVDSNMNKAKTNVATLESKKILVDSIKQVNKTVENLKGIGDSELGANVEKLDDDMLRESIKLEALHEDESPAMTKAEAEEFLKTL